jgi:hypothetical protein
VVLASDAEPIAQAVMELDRSALAMAVAEVCRNAVPSSKELRLRWTCRHARAAYRHGGSPSDVLVVTLLRREGDGVDL